MLLQYRVEHAVDEGAAVLGGVLLGELDGLVNDDLGRGDRIGQFPDGEAEKALRAMAEKGRLHVKKTREEAADALVERWKKGGVSRPEEHLIFCRVIASF